MKKVSCGERIKQALSYRGMTQTELCERTGIKKSAMSQYCSGAFVPRQDRTYAIAVALDVSEAWLMGFDVPMDRENPDTKIDAGITELTDIILKLSPSNRSKLLELSRLFLAEQQRNG